MGREMNTNTRYPTQSLKMGLPSYGVQSTMVTNTTDRNSKDLFRRTAALKMSANDFEVSGKTGDDDIETGFYEEYFTANERIAGDLTKSF